MRLVGVWWVWSVPNSSALQGPGASPLLRLQTPESSIKLKNPIPSTPKPGWRNWQTQRTQKCKVVQPKSK